MTCQQIAEFLMSYVNQELDEATHQRFEEHLAECPDCVAYLDTYRETIKASKTAFAEAIVPRERMPDEMIHAILAAWKRGAP